jgi:hypothetical protein
MQAGEFDDAEFFGTLAGSGARVLLIGRRALIALGAPVMTVDYDLWLHVDDIDRLNAAFIAHDHEPSCSADEARRRGRYVIENGERIDVMVARAATTKDGTTLRFEEAWSRRQTLTVFGATVALPSIEDLIVTKLWGSRPKDLLDIQWLIALRGRT